MANIWWMDWKLVVVCAVMTSNLLGVIWLQLVDVEILVPFDIFQRSVLILRAAHALLVLRGDLTITEDTTAFSTVSWCNALFDQTNAVVNIWRMDWKLVVYQAVMTSNLRGVVWMSPKSSHNLVNLIDSLVSVEPDTDSCNADKGGGIGEVSKHFY